MVEEAPNIALHPTAGHEKTWLATATDLVTCPAAGECGVMRREENEEKRLSEMNIEQ